MKQIDTAKRQKKEEEKSNTNVKINYNKSKTITKCGINTDLPCQNNNKCVKVCLRKTKYNVKVQIGNTGKIYIHFIGQKRKLSNIAMTTKKQNIHQSKLKKAPILS